MRGAGGRIGMCAGQRNLVRSASHRKLRPDTAITHKTRGRMASVRRGGVMCNQLPIGGAAGRRPALLATREWEGDDYLVGTPLDRCAVERNVDPEDANAETEP